MREHRTVPDERVELAVLAAGVDAEWKFCEQPLVVLAPAEGGVEGTRVNADERRLEACVEELAREIGRVMPPEREQAALAGRGETTLAVGTDILQEQVLLAMPMQRVCSQECKGICPVCGRNRNETACDCHVESDGDERWSALRKLELHQEP